MKLNLGRDCKVDNFGNMVKSFEGTISQYLVDGVGGRLWEVLWRGGKEQLRAGATLIKAQP